LRPRDLEQATPISTETGEAGQDVPLAEGTAAIVVSVVQRGGAQRAGEPDPARAEEARLEEAVGLAQAIGLEVVERFLVNLRAPRPATLLGQGKVEDLAVLVRTHEVSLVIIDAPLTPVQQRNLERALKAKVLDRTGLILEIFGRRARTREGRLQVEHAHLTYQKSRLVRSWTHLERQRGGFGFLGGPGETQIEADRRIIQERLDHIEKELESVRRTRRLHRSGRKRAGRPAVSLVGYTNAGKSTLFNRLTGAGVLAENMLFATLDPTVRTVVLPGGTEIGLSDTVGFISDLPTSLIAAFRATLEEVVEADLILHVRDIADPETDARAGDVQKVLVEIGIEDDTRLLEVWNKADLLPGPERESLENMTARRPEPERPVLISAVTGDGVGALLTRIEQRVREGEAAFQLALPPSEGAAVNWLYSNGRDVEEGAPEEDGTRVFTAWLTEAEISVFTSRFPSVSASPA
jgi:GTP-binding protein HflX